MSPTQNNPPHRVFSCPLTCPPDPDTLPAESVSKMKMDILTVRDVKIFPLMIVAVALSGCAQNIPIHHLDAVDEGKASEVVIYRKWGFVNGGARFAVKVDKVSVGTLGNDEFVVFGLAPGMHQVDLALGDSIATALVEAKPGKHVCFTYYSPFFNDKDSYDLTPLPCAEAKAMTEGKKGHHLN